MCCDKMNHGILFDRFEFLEGECFIRFQYSDNDEDYGYSVHYHKVKIEYCPFCGRIINEEEGGEMMFLVNSSDKTVTVVETPEEAKNLCSKQLRSNFDLGIHGDKNIRTFKRNNPEYRNYRYFNHKE